MLVHQAAEQFTLFTGHPAPRRGDGRRRSGRAGVPMTPWWVVAACALVLGVVGHLTGRELATGGYRIPEDEATHPPGNPWWTGPATALFAGVAASAVGGEARWAALPAFLLLAWLTVALIWIDLDVHRLPVGLVVPGGAAIAVLLAVASVAEGGRAWLSALIGAGVMGLTYLVLGVPARRRGRRRRRPARPGARRPPRVAVASAHLVVGLAAGFLVGGVAAIALLVGGRVGLKSSIAYGPAMCLGVVGRGRCGRPGS